MSDFPLDWDEWERQYKRWTRAYGLQRSKLRISGQNFMADEVMGTYNVGESVAEISAVTFPNLTDRGHMGNLIHRTDRMVGITWLTRDSERVSGEVVHSFPELEHALQAGPPSD